MQYEIDYIPVGTGEKGGDAIAFRYGDFSDPTKQNIVILDGGTKDSGKLLIDHVKRYYGTDYVDLVIASHLHNDHISGLTEVLENLRVGKLAIHCPWDYSSQIKRMTNTSSSLQRLETKLEKSLGSLSSLVDMAESKGIEIVQPFQGEEILTGLYVLGPAEDYYHELLANFGVTPEAKEVHAIERIVSITKDAISWVAEEFNIETLSDDYPDTSPENNSSLILLLAIENRKFIFTGDAGKDALNKAISFAESCDVDLSGVYFMDMPHHGSKHNVGPTILDKLKPQNAFISCPPEGDPKHPSRKVINALVRRGCKTCTTKRGQTICHPSETAPSRDGWVILDPESFYEQVEE